MSLRFGGVQALDEVSCHVDRGEICGLIGPNGAGKTTLFNCITRLYTAASGHMSVEGQSIDRLAPRDIAARGIARTFQNLGVYNGMSVLENVLLGAHHLHPAHFFETAIRPWKSDRRERQTVERCMSILDDLGLAAVADHAAGSLSYGTAKRVEIARAIAAEPRLLLLDEPAAGLTHAEVSEFADLIRRLQTAFKLTILLVEHNMGLVMGLCARLVVLHLGRNLAEGTPAVIQSNPAVIAAYLGDAE